MGCRKIGPLFAVEPLVIFLQGAIPEVIALQNRRSFSESAYGVWFYIHEYLSKLYLNLYFAISQK